MRATVCSEDGLAWLALKEEHGPVMGTAAWQLPCPRVRPGRCPLSVGRQDREGRGPAVRPCHSPAPQPTWLGAALGAECARLRVNLQFCPPASHSPGLLPRRGESRGPSPEPKAEEMGSP